MGGIDVGGWLFMNLSNQSLDYDTGVCPGGHLTRAVLDREVVQRDMEAIARDLHCQAVRIVGAEHPLERLDWL